MLSLDTKLNINRFKKLYIFEKIVGLKFSDTNDESISYEKN